MNRTQVLQFTRAGRGTLAAPALVMATLAAGAILAGHGAGINVLRLTRDPSAIHYGRPSDGAISLLGVVCWAACFGGLVVTALARRALGDHERFRVYGLVAAKWLAVSKPWRDRAAFPAVVVSLGLLVASALLDLVDDLTDQASDGFGNVLDDALKIGGIAAFVVWTAGSIWTALSSPAISPPLSRIAAGRK